MAQKKKRFRLQYVFLILLIWLSFWLRLLNAEAFSFWTDEGLTPLRSSYSLLEILSNHIIIQEGVTNDTHPPFFYLMIHFSRQLFGETDFAYRYPSLLASLLLVPLLYQFGRRLNNRRLGMVVALLTAVNPLQIWYANEARMYTLLVLLTAGASFVLWRALQIEEIGDWGSESSNPVNLQSPISNHTIYQYLILYLLLAGLAFYTHYTAILLILGQGFFWLWLLWRRGYKKLILGTAVVGVLLAIPLIPFTIPRLFTGAEANYYNVPPLIMLQDVIRFFHLGRTVDFEQPFIKLISLLALGFLLLGFYGAKSNLKRLFLFVYLMAVVFGLMAGSLIFKPMYQGVRHIMIGSPAFILLVSMGLVFAAEQFSMNSKGYQVRRWGWGIVAALGVVFILGGSLLAVNNLYFDDRFGKDDHHKMIQFIEERAGENDLILYNNAVLLPLHEHYQTRPDVDLAASPIYPYQADETALPQLESLIPQYDRIWFVTGSPADGRDRDKVVQSWLNQHTRQIDDYHFPANMTIVRTILYETTGPETMTLPENSQPLNIVWPDLPNLAGISYEFEQPAGTPTLWFSLYWQGEPPEPKTAMRFNLQDSEGRSWWAEAEQKLQPGNGQWPETPFVRQSYQLPLPPGTPPGIYTLLAQPLAHLSGDPIGQAEPLGVVNISPSSNWPVPPDPIGFPALSFANGLTLQTVEIPAEEVRPGHNLPVTLLWRTGDKSLSDLRYELAVIGPDGRQLRTQTDPPGARWLNGLPANTLFREQTGLFFPPETEPGTYGLRWQLLQGDDVVPGRPFWRPWTSEKVIYGQVEVLPWPLETDLPAGIDPIEVKFGSDISLAGYEIAPDEDRLNITLVWQAHNQPAANYLVFLHLVNENEEIVTQIDSIPVSGLRPTEGWRPGEVLSDNYTLPLPPDLPPGNYDLWLGLYHPETNERLPIVLEGIEQANGRLLLESFSFE